METLCSAIRFGGMVLRWHEYCLVRFESGCFWGVWAGEGGGILLAFWERVTVDFLPKIDVYAMHTIIANCLQLSCVVAVTNIVMLQQLECLFYLAEFS